MNIIIVGCGKVGSVLTEQLNEKGNNITVIDLSKEKVDILTNKFDVMGVSGNGATHLVQQQAGIAEADMLIAVTGSDELNLLCCLIAKKAGKRCHTIARVRDPEYSSEAPYLKEELGLALVINPEYAAAAEIARVLRFPSAMKIDTFSKGRVELLKFRLPEKSPLVGCAVKEIAGKFHCDVLVCTVERDDDAFIANGDFVFEEKDVISIIATPHNASVFFKHIKYRINPVKNVMIVGGGDITRYLCEILDKFGIRATVIEKDRQRCRELAEKMDNIAVINGDAADQALLMEEGIETTDAFVALTNLDEENIFLSIFAKSVNKGKLVTKINRIDFDDVIKHLDLDSTIYPKNITSEIIVRYIRAMKNTIGSNVETYYSVIKGKVEASEFIVREASDVVGIPLMNMKLKSNLLVASIIRDKKVIIPKGQDSIQIGDSVVVVTSNLVLHDISDILAS